MKGYGKGAVYCGEREEAMEEWVACMERMAEHKYEEVDNQVDESRMLRTHKWTAGSVP